MYVYFMMFVICNTRNIGSKKDILVYSLKVLLCTVKTILFSIEYSKTSSKANSEKKIKNRTIFYVHSFTFGWIPEKD